MDKTQIALNAAENLVKAEEAMTPYRSQIDAFMTDMAPMDEEAQTFFEEWAMQLNETCRAFRAAGILYDRYWPAAQYVQAAVLKIPVSPI